MMFAKPYKLKSNNTLKNSEKKHLAQRIQDEFPLATEDKAKELVPLKASCSCMKLIIHSGETIGVYVVDGFPMLLDLADGLMPTVYALWKVPDLVPMLTIHPLVLSKISNGAPLYVPGVLPAAEGGFSTAFARGAAVGVHTSDNAAAAFTGRALISSADLLLRASGVCVQPAQVCRDLLSREPRLAHAERPQLPPPAPLPHAPTPATLIADLAQLRIVNPVKEEWPSLGRASECAPPHAPRLITEVPEAPIPAQASQQMEPELEDSVLDDSQVAEDNVPVDMNGLLQWCLLGFIKQHGKTVELPLKTNLLYKNYLMPLCPPDRSLDVKKSSYKKMGKFLEAMQKEGLLEVREIEKGVAAAVALNTAHPQVRSHRAITAPAPAPPTISAEEQYVPPRVRELYCVTAAVVDLFAPLKKGSALSGAEVRGTVEEHVRARKLPAPRGLVALDPLLAKILNKPEQEQVKWDEVINCVQGKMTAATEMQFPDGSVRLMKSRLEPVRMTVASRSGNKKVTLVSNLEAFGFHLAGLAGACQAGAAAACCVTRTPAAAADQLMLQGDQTHFIAKLLIEKYGLPKKFVEGADKALKKKK